MYNLPHLQFFTPGNEEVEDRGKHVESQIKIYWSADSVRDYLAHLSRSLIEESEP